MKIKTQYYGVFVKTSGKWSKTPLYGEYVTKDDIIWNNELNDRNDSFNKHKNAYLKVIRKYQHKKVKLLRQVWEE